MVSHVGTKLVVCAECSDYLGGVREYADNATIGDAVYTAGSAITDASDVGDTVTLTKA